MCYELLEELKRISQSKTKSLEFNQSVRTMS